MSIGGLPLPSSEISSVLSTCISFPKESATVKDLNTAGAVTLQTKGTNQETKVKLNWWLASSVPPSSVELACS